MKIKIRKLNTIFLCLLMVVAVFAVGPMNIGAEEEPPGEPPEEPPEEPGLEGEGEWWVMGNGTYFEITNSIYLNITLTSSENVYVHLESIPNVVSYHIEAHCTATSSELTLSGFESSRLYYRYQDGNLQEEFTTDESGSYVYTQDISTLHHVFIEETESTIYIDPDGNVVPSTAPISKVDDTYTLTDNIYESIFIQKSGIILDGNGYSVTKGVGSYGIYLGDISGVTIMNLAVNGFSTGIYLGTWSSGNTISGNTISCSSGITLGYWSSNTISGNTISGKHSGINGMRTSLNTISGNTISGFQNGIYMWVDCNSNTISGNTISGNDRYGIFLYAGPKNNIISGNTVSGNYWGIYLWGSSTNTLRNNAMTGNTYNFCVDGHSASEFVQDIDSSNTIDGKPIYYWVDRSYETVPSDAGFVGIVNSHHITVQDLTITNNFQGILFAYTSDSTIQNVDVSGNLYGIQMLRSKSNTISGNTVSDNDWFSIRLDAYSNGNTISGNTISGSNHGIYLRRYSNSNTISGNTVSGNSNSIYMSSSSSNTISGNTVLGNSYGIRLDSSNGNIISGNTVSNNNWFGIRLSQSSTNTISGNIVSGNNQGIVILNSNDNTISGNTVSGNYNEGIILGYSSSNTISGNTISSNSDGIYLYANSNSNTINGNTVSGNGYGIYLSQSNSNTISGNIVSGNGYGIYLFQSSSNIIFHNNIITNTFQLDSIQSTNTWDNGDGEGNHWSDYTGLDDGSIDPRTGLPRVAGDGIGDTNIPHQGVEWYPLMSPWTPSPVDVIEELKQYIQGLDVPQGVKKSLIKQLNAATNALSDGHEETAINILSAFINHVESLRDEGKLTQDQADYIISSAQAIIDMIQSG